MFIIFITGFPMFHYEEYEKLLTNVIEGNKKDLRLFSF